MEYENGKLRTGEIGKSENIREASKKSRIKPENRGKIFFVLPSNNRCRPQCLIETY